MLWKDKKCRCWHDVSLPLFFIDGLIPSEVIDKTQKKSKQPDVLERFRQSDLFRRIQHEFGSGKIPITKHSYIWENYGVRLFQLFDLRNPELWQKYSDFLKEYEELADEHSRHKGIVPIPIDPPRYDVC
jgi:hypothetical protein